MNGKHPYKDLEKLRVWKVVNKGIKDLQVNGDLEEKTARAYIVGYLSKLLLDSGLVTEPTPETQPALHAKSHI